ncbi:MAG: hypothetical protein LUC85_03675 [Bacteroidales bacterium]|nr:hypothetical protein [Bacteroidales bacterium]MCD8393919.1 hypothetical protein [Bacteroidales bacterium]
MRKLLISSIIFAALTSCGNGNQSSQEATTDTVAEAIEAPAQPQELVLTDTGVGPIQLGMNAANVPATVEGLYDRTAREMACDDEIITGYLNDNTIITMELDENDNISGISVSSDAPVKIQTTSGDPYISR